MKLTKDLVDGIKRHREVSLFGSEGTVYLYQDFALKQYHDFYQDYLETLKDMKSKIDELKNEYDVNTPRILDCAELPCKSQILAYILMERANGTAVYETSYDFLRKIYRGYQIEDSNIMIAKYTKYMSEMLAEGKQEHFDKFVHDMFSIEKSPFIKVDAFGRNYNYDEKTGFTLLDLTVLKHEKPEIDIATQTKYVCRNSLAYIDQLSYGMLKKNRERQISCLKEVIKKTYRAAKNNLPEQHVRDYFQSRIDKNKHR